jgi:hypothetical protein
VTCILVQQESGGGYGETWSHPSAAISTSVWKLRLLFLFFFGLKTSQDIEDDLIAENILIL